MIHTEVTNPIHQKYLDFAEAAGLRYRSKRWRVYSAIVQIIMERGSATVDQMIDALEPLGVFLSVTNRRANVANLLSGFKTKKLMTSDHRGNWFLRSIEPPNPEFKRIVTIFLENSCPSCRQRVFDALSANLRAEEAKNRELTRTVIDVVETTMTIERLNTAIRLGDMAKLRLRAEILIQYADAGQIPLDDKDREILERITVSPTEDDHEYLGRFDTLLENLS